MIELYHSEGCPFCVKVLPFLSDPERSVKRYESDDIIEYVKEHYAK